jgi:hypothetical protein
MALAGRAASEIPGKPDWYVNTPIEKEILKHAKRKAPPADVHIAVSMMSKLVGKSRKIEACLPRIHVDYPHALSDV